MASSSLQSTPGPLSNFVSSWNWFWFAPRSPLTLGMIRFCAGFVILYIHLVYTLDLHSLVGKNAWVSLEAMEQVRYEYRPGLLSWNWENVTDEDIKNAPRGWPAFSLFFHVTDPGWITTIHVCVLIILFLFMIGFCTRVTSVLAWLGILCYIHRTPTTLFGMDTMMNIVMIYLVIGPSGAALSVDRWMASRRARRRGEEPEPLQPSAMANFAIRLLQIHFCIVYLASGLSKLQGPAWWSGWAIWGTMANYSFAPMYSPLYLKFIAFLSSHRWLWELVMIGGAYFTLAVEISFAYLVWRPKWRWFVISCSVMLHTGIAIIMGLATFSLMMMCFVLCFMPTEAVQMFLDSFRSKAPGEKQEAHKEESKELELARASKAG